MSTVVCPLCGKPALQIHPAGRYRILIVHPDGELCWLRFWFRFRRDRALRRLVPADWVPDMR